MRELVKVAIAAGGTGGHLYPALAVYEAILRAEPGAEVLWLCSRRAVDRRILSKAGVGRVVPLPTRPFPSRPGLGMASALVALLASTLISLRAILRFRPRCLLSLGSHVGLPAGLAAKLAGVPLVVHEQNVLPGRAVRLLARLAHTVALSYPATLRLLRSRPRRAVVTGMPVRREVLEASREGARRELGLGEGEIFVLAFGGSLGARSLNDAFLGAWERLERRAPNLRAVLVAGRDFDRVRWRASSLKHLRLLRFAHDLPALLAAADVVVSRAGASTVAELMARGVAAILVPYPLAMGGHQLANALYLARRGAAVVVEERELSPERLTAELERLALLGGRGHNTPGAAEGALVSGAAERVAGILLHLCCRRRERR